jgi:phosphohistidine phosphatase SixA
MFLYLVQHGEAVPESENSDRPLTPTGRQDVENIGAFLAQVGVRVPTIVHSGKQRAADTAATLAAAMGGDAALVQRARILPGDSTEWLAEEIGTWRTDTMVCGHQPFIGRLVSRMVLGKEAPILVDVTPGTVVCLARRGATGAWFIAWMLTPTLFRK